MLPFSLKTCSQLAVRNLRYAIRPVVACKPFTRCVSTSQQGAESAIEEGRFDDERVGYYRLRAGDIIEPKEKEDPRYEAVRKLGWGINSTVWVGRNLSDTQLSTFGPKYVGLKIMNRLATEECVKAEASDTTVTNEVELLMRTYQGVEPKHRPRKPDYNEQGLTGPPHPGWRHVSGILGAYTCNDGGNQVIVLPLYGEDLYEYCRAEPERRLKLPLVKRIARQTLLALDYLHSMCGIIHCDVKPSNLLRDFAFGPEIDDIVETIISKEPDAGRDGYSASLWMPHEERFGEVDVVLGDYSHASWADLIQRSPRAIGSPALKAPELVLGYAYSPKIDIWAFGCTIYELLTNDVLFRFPKTDPRHPNDLARDVKYHLSLMQDLIGEPFFSSASEGTITIEKGFIGPDGCIKSLDKGETLEERIGDEFPASAGDKDKFTGFIRKCLRIKPKDRASASELLHDPWMVSD